MSKTRTRSQKGSVFLEKRANGHHVWIWRIRRKNATGEIERPKIQLGTIKQFRNRDQAETERDRRRFEEKVSFATSEVTFGDIVNRYIKEEMPPAYSTQKGYRSLIKVHVMPKWGTMPVTMVKAFDVKNWLLSRDLEPKSKGNLKGLMQGFFRCAMLWEWMDIAVNPMQLIQLRGISKRQNKPRILTSEELWSIFNRLEDPWRTMAIAQFCLGLRLSELLALKWCDFDWLGETLAICRRNVNNHIEETTKSEASNDDVPLHHQVALIFRAWREKTEFKGDNDFVFASPYSAGEKPYFPNGFQQRHLGPAAKAAGLTGIGTHTLRHTYRAWLDETGAPIGVQQKLMRHADVSTTMKYGGAYPQARRDVNRMVVEKVFTA